MKIKKILISLVTILVLIFSFGIFSLSANDAQATPTSAGRVMDKA